MTFQPVVPIPGVGGWNFIQRTQEAQQEVFAKSPLLAREIAHFKENIASAVTVDDLVDDRMMFKVALGAFGLEDEIDKKFFMRKVLDEGTEDDGAFALRLVDPRYRQMSEAFGYGNLFGPNVLQSDFAQRMVDAYEIRQFEKAVGNADNSMRLALTFKREIADYASSASADDAAWFSVMGNRPLRAVFETAFGLPTAFATLDIDRQQADLQEKMRAKFGDDSLAVFNDPENVETMVREYLARAQINQGPTNTTPGFAALNLLQSSGLGGNGITNLILSNR